MKILPLQMMMFMAGGGIFLGTTMVLIMYCARGKSEMEYVIDMLSGFVYTCRRLIDRSLSDLYIHAGD